MKDSLRYNPYDERSGGGAEEIKEIKIPIIRREKNQVFTYLHFSYQYFTKDFKGLLRYKKNSKDDIMLFLLPLLAL